MAVLCGYCQSFLPQSTNSAADDGLCRAIIEDGVGIEVSIYDVRAEKCNYFKPVERIRTDPEFQWDPFVRHARGFEEK